MAKEAKVTAKGPKSGRPAIQRLVRFLVEHPDRANDFLIHPAEVAREQGIVVTGNELQLIFSAITELRKGQIPVTHADFPECEHIEVPTSHVDFPECHHIEVARPKKPKKKASQPQK